MCFQTMYWDFSKGVCFGVLVYMFSNYVLKIFKRDMFWGFRWYVFKLCIEIFKKYVLRIQRVCFQSMYWNFTDCIHNMYSRYVLRIYFQKKWHDLMARYDGHPVASWMARYDGHPVVSDPSRPLVVLGTRSLRGTLSTCRTVSSRACRNINIRRVWEITTLSEKWYINPLMRFSSGELRPNTDKSVL